MKEQERQRKFDREYRCSRYKVVVILFDNGITRIIHPLLNKIYLQNRELCHCCMKKIPILSELTMT